MKAESKIKRHILMSMVSEQQLDDCDWIDLSTEDGINFAWGKARRYEDIFSDVEILDEEEDFRCSGENTKLTCNGFSRHYESEQVAKKLSCGAFVSWIYWSGGGKHGEPEMVDWISKAFNVSCTEEEKLVTIRTYSAIKDA